MILETIVGETGSGKSTLAKSIFSQQKFGIVYDFQNEYNVPIFDRNLRQPKFKLTPDQYKLDKFILFIKNSKNFCFCIEEATGLFRGNVGTDFVQCVLSKRHTNNRFILVFHALHRIPPQIFEFTDRLYLFKTMDLPENVERKFPAIFQKWNEVQSKPRYYHEKINLSNLVK
jgi:ABC-type dipeptide/oligopeptide/nickel transport system ATPase component